MPKTISTSIRFSAFAALLIALPVQAAPMPIQPGLWQVAMKMKTGDKETDPQAELQKSLAKLSPEQRQQMTAMLAKSGIGGTGLDSSGVKVCYTQALLNQGESLGHDPRNQCESHVDHQTNQAMTMNFKCQDGTTGVGEWKFTDKSHYDGHLTFTKKDGKVSEITQHAKFLGSDCGEVKPFVLPAKTDAKS